MRKKESLGSHIFSLCAISVFMLVRYPLLLVTVVVVFFWAFDFHRRRVLGVWSNFQPMLTGLVILIVAACLPLAWQCLTGNYKLQQVPGRHEESLGALYLISLVLILQIPILLIGKRVGMRAPKPKRKTTPGFPFDGGEPGR